MKERILYPPNLGREGNAAFLTAQKLRKYTKLIERAKEARAYPDQSGYFVRTAGITKRGTIWVGGNKEYSLSDAFIHGETAVVSGLKDKTDDPIEAIAWYRKGKITVEDMGRPCGNCRDVLLKYCGVDLVLLNGNEKAIVYTKLKDFLFEDFKEKDPNLVDRKYVDTAIDSFRRGNNVYLPNQMNRNMYGALLVSESGLVWQGSHYTNGGYDSVTPVMSAIINWINNYPKGQVSQKHLKLSKLIVVGEFGMPRPFYRDRQAFLELDEILKCYTKGTEPLKVEIVYARKGEGETKILKAFSTDSHEWLPYPFSPGTFGMHDALEGQLAKLIRK